MFSEKIAFSPQDWGLHLGIAYARQTYYTELYPVLSLLLLGLRQEITKLPNLALGVLQPRQALKLECSCLCLSSSWNCRSGSSSRNEGCILDTNQNCVFYGIKIKIEAITYCLVIRNISTENKVVLHCIIFTKMFFLI